MQIEIAAFLQQLDALLQNNQLEQARAYLEQTLQQAKQEQDFSALMTIYNEWIGFCRDTGDFSAMLTACRELKELMQAHHLEGTQAYATSCLNIANAFRAAGKHTESLQLYQEVAAIYRKLLQPDDLLIASYYNNLALLYQEMQDHEQACTALQHALEIVRCKEGADSLKVAISSSNYASSLLQLGKIEEALQQLHTALDLFSTCETSDFHYSAALSAMGEAQYRLGNYPQAAIFYEHALFEIEKHMGKNPFYQMTQENLQTVYQKLPPHALSGKELCKQYYETYGAPMIREQFPAYEKRIAVGMIGPGSDCYGFDDVFSEDHDFGPAFCMWLTPEDYDAIGEKLQAAYEALPDTFCGVKRLVTPEGSNRFGVFSIPQFFQMILQHAVPSKPDDWYALEEADLFTICKGALYRDDLGVFCTERGKLMAYYPDEVWYRKLAQAAACAAQAGQYNYSRMAKRKDWVAVQLAKAKFLRHAMELVYLLNRQYAPYDKWMRRGLESCRTLRQVVPMLEKLVQIPDVTESERAADQMEQIAAELLQGLAAIGITPHADRNYLADCVPALLEKAEDAKRLELVDTLVQMEWEAFDQVQNIGGRADCQDDWETFSIMRKSQYRTWKLPMLKSFLQDFQQAAERGWNLITEKYARMMETTYPDEYAAIADQLPPLTDRQKAIIAEITAIQVQWMEAFQKEYPKLAHQARVIHTAEDTVWQTSYETYLRGELSTYSEQTLALYGAWIVSLFRSKQNLAKKIMEQTVHFYGYASLEEAEAHES